MKKNLTLLLFLLLFFNSTFAQEFATDTIWTEIDETEKVTKTKAKPKPKRQEEKGISNWSVSLQGGVCLFDGDIKQAYTTNPLATADLNNAFGATIDYTLTPVWNIGVEYFYLKTGADLWKTSYYKFSNEMNSVDLYTSFNFVRAFFPKKDSKWGVWAGIGLGMGFYKLDYQTKNNGTGALLNGTTRKDKNINVPDGQTMTTPVKLLVEYNFTKNLALGANLEFRAHNKDILEGRYMGVTNDHIEVVALALRWKFDAQRKDHTRNFALVDDERVFVFDTDSINNVLDSLQKQVDKNREDIDNMKPELERIPELEDKINLLEEKLCDDGPDNDGDGVPDCRDRELETPPNTPVDFWGVGYKGYGDAAAIYFDFDKTDLNAEANRAIEIAAEKLVKDPELIVEVRGFTDNMGSVQYNESLSQRRADKVKLELVNKYGINADRVLANGKGKITTPPTRYRLNRKCIFLYNK